MPTPPNISLPITTPKDVAIATCHNGMVGGIINGISAHVTKNPSLIECFLTTANKTSQNPPAINAVIRIGKMEPIPIQKFSKTERSIPDTLAACQPILIAPKI